MNQSAVFCKNMQNKYRAGPAAAYSLKENADPVNTNRRNNKMLELNNIALDLAGAGYLPG